MGKETERIYKDIIFTLSLIEVIVTDEKQFNLIRKQMLDIAGSISRLGDTNE